MVFLYVYIVKKGINLENFVLENNQHLCGFLKMFSPFFLGLVAACFISIVPGYISRSVAGSYDNEGIAIFCMLFTYYLWIKSVKTGQIYWAALCSVAYFYMVSSWGGYVFLINLIPMHVFTLIICGRFTHKIYIAYSTVYCLGTLLSMQISFVGFQPVQTSEHMLVS